MRRVLVILILLLCGIVAAQVYLPHRRKAFKPAAAVGGSTLGNGLIAHWPIEDGGTGETFTNAVAGGTNLLVIPGTGYWTNGAAVGSFAFWFDGSATYAVTNDPNIFEGLSAMTVSIWAQTDDATHATTSIMCAQEGSAADVFWMQYSGGEDWIFDFVTNVSTAVEGIAQNTTAQTAIFHNVVGVFNSTNQSVTIYTNAVAGNVVATVYPGTVSGPSANKFFIGRWTSGSYWKGRLDDCRIWNRALTTNEIAELYAMKNP